jgi:hypothetical protein
LKGHLEGGNENVSPCTKCPPDIWNAPVDSSNSSSQWIDDVTGPYTYLISNIHIQQPTQSVYEWVDLEFYNMCYQKWRDPLHMAGTQGTPSLNPRYYAHVYERVLCNAECAAHVVVYFHVL